jgi:ribosomal protein S12 methylthiotransferase accessory factor
VAFGLLASGAATGKWRARFSPNFSVYVLPPDVVCLYSENRKVFLRGELYCALASRIGAGERREAINNALCSKFPAVKIDEAFRRLLDRGFVVSTKLIDGTAVAYWTSLGLDAGIARENLGKTGVRIESMAAAGASELNMVLRELGVRVVDRSADLTVVLVDDYLDGELAEFNRQRLAQKQKWLLMQPAGIVPLVGPIFSPEKSACWTCLAERMKWNRQIKAFLDRKRAHSATLHGVVFQKPTVPHPPLCTRDDKLRPDREIDPSTWSGLTANHAREPSLPFS